MDIKAQRLKLRFSQYRLASDAGVSRFRLSLHERGELRLSPVELDHIRKALLTEADRLRNAAVEIEPA